MLVDTSKNEQKMNKNSQKTYVGRYVKKLTKNEHKMNKK